jgi:hypothetical protein
MVNIQQNINHEKLSTKSVGKFVRKMAELEKQNASHIPRNNKIIWVKLLTYEL